MKKLMLLAVVSMSLVGCAKSQYNTYLGHTVPENWETQSINNKCYYAGRAKANGEIIVSNTIIKHVISDVYENLIKGVANNKTESNMIAKEAASECELYFQQGISDWGKESVLCKSGSAQCVLSTIQMSFD